MPNIYAFQGMIPVVDPTAYVHPSAVLIGDVIVGPGVYVAPWRLGSGAAGLRRALSDSLDRPTRPQLAPLGTATLVGVLGRTRGEGKRAVLGVRLLELDGTLTPWLFLGSGVRAAALAGGPASAGTPPRAAWAAWVESNGEQPRVRVARLTRE